MKKIVRPIFWIFELIYKILCQYSKVVLVVIVVVVSAQVFSRKVLNQSIRWSEEVALLLMVWMAFISLAIGIEKKLHIAIGLFFDRFPRKVQYIIEKATNILIMVFGLVLFYYGIKLMQFTSSSTLPATKWPAATLYAMIPVSGIFIAYFSIIELFNLHSWRNFSFNKELIKEKD